MECIWNGIKVTPIKNYIYFDEQWQKKSFDSLDDFSIQVFGIVESKSDNRI